MDDQAKGKDRSPNYPAISLEAAFAAVRKLYTEDHTSPVPLETLARYAGHNKMSGPARSKLAAIRQYGLVESAGPGKVRVSQRALPLFFHGAGDKEYQQTLKEMALTPPLFSQLFSQYAQASEPTLRLHLVRDRKFSEEGAKKLARVFKDTLAFAKVVGSSYNEPESEAGDEAESDFQVDSSSHGQRVTAQGSVREASPDRSSSRLHQTPDFALNYILPIGVKARVTFETPGGSELTRRTVQRLRDYLKLLEDDLAPEPEPEPRGPEERGRLRDLEVGDE